MAHVNANSLSNNDLYQLRMARWKARTDLTYLAHHILGYPDVTGPKRFPFMNLLQRFPLPEDVDLERYERLDRGNWIYTPPLPLQSLPGKRRVLILDPRGFLKTTINAQSHSIQWILNYPDIAMMIIQSNGDKAEMILGEIKRHFQANPRLRSLFPDYVPQKRVFDWGNRQQFTTEARGQAVMRKEPTLMTGSIDKGSSGIHVDVMKFSDIVEPSNVKTPEQIESVIQSFGMMENLLVAPNYWIDVEGTRYDFSDLYGRIIDAEEKRAPEKRLWQIHVRGCYKKDTSSTGGGPELFTPKELDLPFLYDANNQKISNWPERVTTEILEEKRTDPTKGEYLFATQQLNDPRKVDENSTPFPVNQNYPKWISVDNFRRNVRIVHHTTTVDTAETKTDRADFTAITSVAWDQAGRPYVVEVRHGKWLPDEIITQIIAVQMKFQPLYMSIEETSYVRGFKDGLLRKLHVMGMHINFKFIRRETNISKKERILNTLQPWYKDGELRFMRGLGAGEDTPEGIRLMEALEGELQKFPRYVHDDILDSLSDHFQDRTWLGRLAPSSGNPWESISEPARKKLLSDQMDRFLMIDKFPFERNSAGEFTPVPGDDFYSRTGGL
jgi:predicted phage terminase large subunit-like protein